MKEWAETFQKVDITPFNWVSLFGQYGIVNTPIGEVKMGENQYIKMNRQGRNGKLGMVKPTLSNPDVIIEDKRKAINGINERDTSFVFVKSFVNEDGRRFYHFTSITVKQDSKEVVVSNQERSSNRISKLLQQGRIAWINPKFSLYPKAQIETSVSLSDTNNPTQSDNRVALLGVNSPELSRTKLRNNSETAKEMKKKKRRPSRADAFNSECNL